MSKNKKAPTGIVIDVDKVIDKYNQENPTLKPLNQSVLAEKLGVTTITLMGWKKGNTPDVLRCVMVLMEIGSMGFDEIVTNESQLVQ